MPNMDRVMARALAEAGYMPLSEYIEQFGEEAAARPAMPLSRVSARRSRPWNVPAHFAGPPRPFSYDVSYRKRRSRA